MKNMSRKKLIITIYLFLLCVMPLNVYAITYYVRFNNNGGVGTMSNQTFTTDEEKYLTTNTFTKAGYDFIGWNSNSSGTGTWYMPSKKVKNLSNTEGTIVDIYAQWMESNQGSITTGGSQFPKDTVGNYSYENYKKYTVNVVVNNGTVDTASKTIEYYTNATFTLTPSTNYGNPTVSCTNSQSGTITNNTLTVTSVSNNTTCTVTYALVTFPATLNAQGGTIPNTSGWTVTTTYSEGSTSVSEEAPETNICCATAKPTINSSTGMYTVSGTYVSYSLLSSSGYYCNLSATNASSGGSCSATTDSIFYSASGSDYFTNVYYANPTSSATKTVTYNNPYGTLPTPTKTGNTFDGWYTSAEGGTQITSATNVSASSAHTLYAHWSETVYKVIFLSTKTDKTPLNGVTYQLTGLDYGDNQVSMTTASDIRGRVVFEVPMGVYEIAETIALTDYHMEDSILQVSAGVN